MESHIDEVELVRCSDAHYKCSGLTRLRKPTRIRLMEMQLIKYINPRYPAPDMHRFRCVYCPC